MWDKKNVVKNDFGSKQIWVKIFPVKQIFWVEKNYRSENISGPKDFGS